LARELACRSCRALTTEKHCPRCGSTELTVNWTGLIVIFNPEKSELAKMLGITAPGRYAAKVRR
jgi:DNA-directed RNA polymerase subunit E"